MSSQSRPEENTSLPSKSTGAKNKECCIIHCTDDEGKLISIKDLKSWKSLHIAAVTRQHLPLIELAKTLKEGEIPQIRYHRRCRSVFTLKASTQKSETEADEGLQPHSSDRRSIRQIGSSPILEVKCIFCDKITKYKARTKSREPLLQCLEFRADETIRAAALEKQDSRILAIVQSRDLIASEAHYHKSCFRDFTRKINYTPKQVSEEECKYLDTERTAYAELFIYIRQEIFTKPCIIPVADLTRILLQKMTDLGCQSIFDSTKKCIRRKLESEFGCAARIISDETGKLFFIPNSLSFDQLALENQALKRDRKVREELASGTDQIIKEAALLLREEIKNLQLECTWPPTLDELTEDAVPCPTLLSIFWRCLLPGSTNETKELSDRKARRLKSYIQDLVYGVSGGKIITPKHVLLPFAVKSLTGNVQLVHILNRLGHGVSYSKVLEIDTAFAIKEMSMNADKDVSLPSNIIPYTPTCLVFDNIDRLEETLSGAGTTHRVNGIPVQQKVIGPQPEVVKTSITKTKQRQLEVVPFTLPSYNTGQKPDPPVLRSAEINSDKDVKTAKLSNLVWMLSRKFETSNQEVSSWTGFNIQVRSDISVIQDNVGYLPTIDAPATSMSTVFEVLSQALKIKDALHLNAVVAVFDQAMYAKALEVVWKHNDQFNNIILRMGAFHTICVLLCIIGKRFSDAGLKDICIESGVIAEGSINAVFEGKHYNRAVRLHKLMYEACMRLLWDGFIVWMKESHAEELQVVDDLLTLIASFRDEISKPAYENLISSNTLASVNSLFDQYMEHMRSSNGSMSAFWISYIDIVNILLNLLRASRESNWTLHLGSIRALIPWCFAYDRTNYARHLPWYLKSMLSLVKTHPEVNHYLENGGFSVQLGQHNPFGKIPMDQAIEETVNKDTQTAGGTKGFSTRKVSVARFYLTADYRSACIRQLREMLDISKGKSTHPDLRRSRIQKDERDVKCILDMFQNTWLNPFTSENQELCSLSTGRQASQEVVKHLLGAHSTGEKAYKAFEEERLSDSPLKSWSDKIPRQNLKTFSNFNKTVKVKVQGKDVALKADKALFGHMILIAQNRTLSMKDVLGHPLGSIPWSLATADGTLRKTNKASLAVELEKLSQPAETIPEPTACLIDGMSVVQKIQSTPKTFGDVAEDVFRRILMEGRQAKRIDVVFDVYRDISIKNPERLARSGDKEPTQYKNIIKSYKIHQWRRFLSGSINKTNLIVFLCKEWTTMPYRQRLCGKTLIVAHEDICHKISETAVEEVEALKSNQEEADTRLLLHAKHAADEGYKGIVVVCDDTDVMVLCIANQGTISAPMFQKQGSQVRSRYTNIKAIQLALGNSVCNALLGLHSFTGCDTVSSFAGCGKRTGLKLLNANSQIQSLLSMLGENLDIPHQLLLDLEAFTCQLYGSKKIKNVNELRYTTFCAKKGNIESHQLPPCRDCLQQHIRRANYQAFTWKKCLCAYPEIPSPAGHGWKIQKDTLTVEWMTGKPAPESVMALLSCTCKRSCDKATCTCIKNSMKCTLMCRLSICSNQSEDEEDNCGVSPDSEFAADYYDDCDDEADESGN